MWSKIIENAEAFVKEKLEHEYTGHDYFHALRVYKMATHIANCEGARVEIVQLAALLHDVDDRKVSPETSEDQTNTRTFLHLNGVDEDTIVQICEIIKQVSFGTNSAPPTSPEGKCLQDADRLDALGAMGIARAFAYGGHHGRMMYHPDIAPKLNMTPEEYRKSKSTTINHFYEKLFKLTSLMNTPTAVKIAKEREAYMREFVSRFLDEWEGNILYTGKELHYGKDE